MKKILFVYDADLTKNNSGTQNRAINIINYLKTLNYSIDQFFPTTNKKKRKGNDKIDNIFYKDIKFRSFVKLYYKIKSLITYKKEDRIILYNAFSKNYRLESIANYFAKITENNYDFIVFINSNFAYLVDKIKNKNSKKILLMDDVVFNQFKDKTQDTPLIDYLEKVKDKETEYLNKFDKIIGISESEINIFKTTNNKDKFIHLPAFMDSKNILKKDKYTYDIIYVASGNPHNIKACKWFFDNVYNLLLDKSILFVGKICNKIENKELYKNITFIDSVNNLDDVYNDSKIAICPMFSGTGVKIKVIESFAYGKPVVSNKMGIIGLPLDEDLPALVSDNPNEFANYINTLLTNNEIYKNLSNKALDYFNKHFSYKENIIKLDKIFKKT